MSPVSNSPSTDLLTLVLATKSPAAFAVFRLESTLSYYARHDHVVVILNKIFLRILTSDRMIFL